VLQKGEEISSQSDFSVSIAYDKYKLRYREFRDIRGFSSEADIKLQKLKI
jgi:hypothetical protein